MSIMKKGLYAIFAALAVFALVMTGCDNGGGDPPPPPPSESETSTSLSALQIGKLYTSTDTTDATKIGTNKGPKATTSTGNRNATDPSAINTLRYVNVSDSHKTGAIVTLTFGSDFGGTAKYVKIASDATIAAADFDDTAKAKDYDKTTAANNTSTVADGEKFYVKVTSKNGENIMYYGFVIWVGRNAELADVEFQGGTWPVVSVETVGSPVTQGATETEAAAIARLDAAAADDLGKIQFPYKQPNDGFSVKAIAQDEDAQSTVAISIDGTDWTTLANGGKYIFDEDEPLYVKVISKDKNTTNYYKIVLVLLRSVDIPYGTPSTVDAANPDNIWNTAATDWLYIDRANTAEGAGWLDMDEADRSHGRAKLLWDEGGIWVYAQVWEKTVSETEATSNHHESSSVELFINENNTDDPLANQATGSTESNVTSNGQRNGGQYRMGANGETSGAPSAAVADFNALNQFSAKKYVDSDTMPEASYWGAKTDITTGYVVIFHAPWRYPDLYRLTSDNTNKKELHLELQINATGDDGARAGVLNWNNENSNSYGSLADYGDATLNLGNNTLGPLKPVLVQPPVGIAIAKDATTNKLAVTATAVEGATATLTYQWYKATDRDTYTGATAATGAGNNTNSYTAPPTATTGFSYYFVTVTSTIGAKTKSVNSRIVVVNVYDTSASKVLTVDLSKLRTTGIAGSGQGAQPNSWTFANGTLTGNFTADNQRGFIDIADNQIEPILSAASLKINITGTMEDSTGTAMTSGGPNFRYFLANYASGENFNATDTSGDAVFSSTIGEKAITFSGNKSALTCRSFLFQTRNSAGLPVTVKITGITIELVY